MKDTNDQAGVSANLAIPQSPERVGEDDVLVTSIDLQERHLRIQGFVV
ncbi:hypothetical protein HanXRQr2_Chr14g0649321 [Helianthus annuus]|uniref:Uncharacterized protein n=1 Tax=Helianthus annuus TaxID=4232 RepID=A0A9K3H827_HELAN|nr:hypothetical protein HanXRQr2_Chr14g0649321 [Helianthus annuus]